MCGWVYMEDPKTHTLLTQQTNTLQTARAEAAATTEELEQARMVRIRLEKARGLAVIGLHVVGCGCSRQAGM